MTVEVETGIKDGKEKSIIDAATPENNQDEIKTAKDTDRKQILSAETPKWKAQLSGDLKTNELLDQYEDLSALANAHLDLLKGNKKDFVVPGDDDADGWGKLYQKMGRPEKSDDYKLDESINETVGNQMRELAYDIGLNQKQFDKLSGVIKDSNENQAVIDEATYKGTAKETEDMLKTEFGDKIEAKLVYMKRGAEKLLTPALRKVFGRYNQLNNPDLVRACIAYGESIADDVSTPASPSGSDEGSWDYPD